MQLGIHGKGGRIGIEFSYIKGIDSTDILVTMLDLFKLQAMSIAAVTRATIVGGPIDTIWAVFEKGHRTY